MMRRTRPMASSSTALDVLERDGARAVAAPGGIVGDDGDRRVLEAELARERRLRHAGHADHVGAVALEAVDLGRGLQARPLRRGIDAAVDDRLAAACAAARMRARSGCEYGSVKSMCVTGAPAPSK